MSSDPSGSSSDDDGAEVEVTSTPWSRASTPAQPTHRYFNAPTTPASRASELAKVQHVCFLCGGKDHQAGQCPSEVCLLCLGRGHRTRDCCETAIGWVPPHGREPRRIAVCTACARVGHTQVHCVEKSLPPDDIAKCRCVACGKLGHLDCTDYEARPRRVSCWNCGAGNHEANDCNGEGMDRWHRLFATALGAGGGKGSGGGKGGGYGGKGGGGQRGGGGGGGGGSRLSDVVGYAPAGHRRDKGGGRGAAGMGGGRGSHTRFDRGMESRVITIAGRGGDSDGRGAGGPKKTISKRQHRGPGPRGR
jgi:hypothetical protein